MLDLFGEDGKVRIALLVQPDDSTVLSLLDASGRGGGLGLVVHQDGSSGIGLVDDQGNDRLRLVQRPNGSEGLLLLDEQGRERVGLMTGPDGSPRLELNGRVLLQAPEK